MVIYRKTAAEFMADVDNNAIVDEIRQAFVRQLGYFPSQEVQSWTNSLQSMERIVRKSGVRHDCGILIEYRIPATAKRIDFVIAGVGESDSKNIVIIELKQWDEAQATSLNGIVVTRLSQGEKRVAHPAYQAYSYRVLLSEFNENIQTKSIASYSCAYLHNFARRHPEPLESAPYTELVRDSPVFFKQDSKTLQEYLARYVGNGKGMDILYEIEAGRIRPSKKLIEHVNALYDGNPAFTLLDSQKVAFEWAVDLALNAKRKSVLIIKGGPGTGKSVISMRLLGELLRRKQELIAFVAPNAAFRDVIVEKLIHGRERATIEGLFKGSGKFYDCKPNTYHCLIVDEAHRLKDHRAFMFKGKNQVRDVINSALISIFFVDDAQRVRPEDIGSVDEIKRNAKLLEANVHELELDVQYRCAGAEGFVNWLDDLFQLRDTGNFEGWDRKDFEFRTFDDPRALYRAIKEKQEQKFQARMLAGYAWKWTDARENPNGEIADVSIPEFDFHMPWNSRADSTRWAIEDSGAAQVGCIHTSQGLEFDYVGVLIGPDLQFDSESSSYQVNWKNYHDKKGKAGLKEEPEALSQLVRNIYKTLMSRALKGCYVYVCDPGLARHIKDRLTAIDLRYSSAIAPARPSLVDRIERVLGEHLKFKTHIPVYEIKAACGQFANGEAAEPSGWIKLDGSIRINRNLFAVQAFGRSMEPKIKDGDLCVFRSSIIGSREGKIVLVQHHGVEDPDYGGAYTIKRYSSIKVTEADGSFAHEEITLVPLNRECSPIQLNRKIGEECVVIGEWVGVA